MKLSYDQSNLLERAGSVEVAQRPATSLGVAPLDTKGLNEICETERYVNGYSPTLFGHTVVAIPPTDETKGVVLVDSPSSDVSFDKVLTGLDKRHLFAQELGFMSMGFDDKEGSFTLFEIPSSAHDFEVAFRAIHGANSGPPLCFSSPTGRKKGLGYVQAISRREHPDWLQVNNSTHDRLFHAASLLFFTEIAEVGVRKATEFINLISAFRPHDHVSKMVGSIDMMLSAASGLTLDGDIEDNVNLERSASSLRNGAGIFRAEDLYKGSERAALWYQELTGRELPTVGSTEVIQGHIEATSVDYKEAPEFGTSREPAALSFYREGLDTELHVMNLTDVLSELNVEDLLSLRSNNQPQTLITS